MNLPLSSEVLLGEITAARDILSSWEAAIRAGIPMLDTPGSEEALSDFLRPLVGELQLVSAKVLAVAEILSSADGS